MLEMCKSFTECKKQTGKYYDETEEFLNKTGTKVFYRFSGFRMYFPDDKEERDTYRIRIERDGKSIEFDYGASIKDTRENKKPTAYNILTCVEKYDPDSFEDFCNEYGYDTDSRKAYGIYEAVCKQWKDVEMLFNDVLDELREIQ